MFIRVLVSCKRRQTSLVFRNPKIAHTRSHHPHFKNNCPPLRLAIRTRPVVLPSETILVRIIKPGENAGQRVGYLMEATMVVIEGASDKVDV